MSLISWLRDGKRTNSGDRSRRTASSRQAVTRCRFTLETLEGRDVPTTLTVSTNLDSGDGSLRAEIDAAHAGDTIIFASSLVGQQINLQSELNIRTSLTIQGPGAGQLTIDGGGYSRVFEMAANTNVTVSGLTISGGGGEADPSNFDPALWDGTGGGILNFGTLTLSGCVLSNNSATTINRGGAIDNEGTLTLSACNVSGNSAREGGGIFNNQHARLAISNHSAVTNNTAGFGADLVNLGTLKISKDSTVGVIAGHH